MGRSQNDNDTTESHGNRSIDVKKDDGNLPFRFTDGNCRHRQKRFPGEAEAGRGNPDKDTEVTFVIERTGGRFPNRLIQIASGSRL